MQKASKMAKNDRPRLAAAEILDIDPNTGREFEAAHEDLQADQDASLDAIIGEFEASDDNVTYRASVNKVPDNYRKGGREEWCADIDSSQIAGIRTYLRDTFGSGVYRIRVFKNSKQVRQFDYHIAKPSFKAQTPLTGDNPALQALMEQMREQGEQIKSLTSRLLQGPATSSTAVIDPLVMMERMSNVMANMRGAAPAHSDTSLDTFIKAAEFAREMQGDHGGGDDGWTGIVKALIQSPEAGNIIKSVMQARQPRGMRRQLPGPQNPNRPPQMSGHAPVQQNNHVPQPVEGNDEKSLGDALQSNMRYLIGKAEKNSDPSLYADWLLDNTAEHIIVPMMNDPNLLNQLCAAFPRMVPVRAWFEELVLYAKEAITGGAGDPDMQTEQETEGNAPGPASFNTDESSGRVGGDQGHAQTDGQASA